MAGKKVATAGHGRATALVVVALAWLLAANFAHATVFPAVGGKGARGEEYRCPAGTVLVGFKGRTGLWIDQIGLICGQLLPGFTTGGVVVPAPRGGQGGGPNEQYCVRDAGVRQLNIITIAEDANNILQNSRLEDRYILAINFACFRMADGTAAGGGRFGGEWKERRGEGLYRGDGVLHTCPGNEYAMGLSIRYGRHVNAVGLICEVLEAPPANDAGSKPAERTDQTMENNTDRPGSDYDRFHIDDQRPDRCQSECLLQRDRCKAWTYVRPGIQHKHAVCYLKSAVPPARSNACCISGVLPSKSRSSVSQSPGGLAPAPSAPPPGAPPSEPPEVPTGAPGASPGAASPNAGPNAPYGSIGEKYAALGGAGGPLGLPSGGEANAPQGGRCQAFQRGTICWHPQIGEAFGVWGLIHAKWSAIGRVEFGYPVTDERPTADGRGRYNHFRGMQYPGRPEASIFWTPQTGAHAVYGLIRDAWAQQGWERGPLGYPTSDEHQDGKYRRVNFERGYVRWAPDTGIEVLK